jgi:hypothetical protein
MLIFAGLDANRKNTNPLFGGGGAFLKLTFSYQGPGAASVPYGSSGSVNPFTSDGILSLFYFPVDI